MKKTILTIGLLCSLYSCSTNQNTNELNKLKNQIVELKEQALTDSILIAELVDDNGLEEMRCIEKEDNLLEEIRELEEEISNLSNECYCEDPSMNTENERY